jgi:hypothetical protein
LESFLLGSAHCEFETRSPTSIVSIYVVDVLIRAAVEELAEVSRFVSESLYLVATTAFRANVVIVIIWNSIWSHQTAISKLRIGVPLAERIVVLCCRCTSQSSSIDFLSNHWIILPKTSCAIHLLRLPL